MDWERYINQRQPRVSFRGSPRAVPRSLSRRPGALVDVSLAKAKRQLDAYPDWLSEKTTPYQHQRDCFMRMAPLKTCALFVEQGLGKSKMLIDLAAWRMSEELVQNMLIITKKGVHAQWARQQIPEHWPEGKVPVNIMTWVPARRKVDNEYKARAHNVLCMNIDALRGKKGFALAQLFLQSAPAFMVIDESHLIKSPYAKRSKLVRELGPLAVYRAIATGTPVTRNLVDAWAQFLFLDWQIIGHRFLTSFRAAYCITAPHDSRIIVGHKNEAVFQAKIAPYTFSIRKEQATDLPPKLYEMVPFELTPEQRKAYNEMRDLLLVQIEGGEVEVQYALVGLLRMQEITCGFLRDAERGIVQRYSNPRMDALKDLLEQRDGPAVIWCRFREDADAVARGLGVPAYHGGATEAERAAMVEAFCSGKQQYLVATPQAGGTGLNLQSSGCQTVIYYSNSFNAGDRWQSEDRVHRIGMKGQVTYFDLVALDTIDERLLASLRAKKKLAINTLDGIRELVK